MQIIPAIDIFDGSCVRLKQGDPNKKKIYSQDPLSMALKWQDEGAQRLHLVNLNGAFGNGQVNYHLIERICSNLTIPVQLGGGIRTMADAERWLGCGIERIILGTIAITEPQLMEAMIHRFGGEAIIIGLDARRGKIVIKGWQETSEEPVISLAKKLAASGIRRIIYTDVLTDGLLQGPNYRAISQLAEGTKLRIIVSGGLAEKWHFQKLIELRYATIEGAIVGTALYENKLCLQELIELYQ